MMRNRPEGNAIAEVQQGGGEIRPTLMERALENIQATQLVQPKHQNVDYKSGWVFDNSELVMKVAEANRQLERAEAEMQINLEKVKLQHLTDIMRDYMMHQQQERQCAIKEREIEASITIADRANECKLSEARLNYECRMFEARSKHKIEKLKLKLAQNNKSDEDKDNSCGNHTTESTTTSKP